MLILTITRRESPWLVPLARVYDILGRPYLGHTIQFLFLGKTLARIRRGDLIDDVGSGQDWCGT